MKKRNKAGILFILIGVGLSTAVLLFPVEQVHVHDTRSGTTLNESTADQYGYKILEYENLSDRGQELYVKTLENGGLYRVPVGKGADDWSYPTEDELRPPGPNAPDNYTANTDVIIKRPENDSHLPPADENPESAKVEGPNQSTVKDYDLMETRTKKPPIGSGAHIPRLGGLVLSLTSLTTGAYLLVSKE